MTKRAFRAFGVATKLHVLSVQWKKAMRIPRPQERVTYDDHIRKCLIQKTINRIVEVIPLSSRCNTSVAQLPVQHQHYSEEVKCSIPLGWLPQGLPGTKSNSTVQHTQHRTQKTSWDCPAWHALTLYVTQLPTHNLSA